MLGSEDLSGEPTAYLMFGYLKYLLSISLERRVDCALVNEIRIKNNYFTTVGQCCVCLFVRSLVGPVPWSRNTCFSPFD